MSDPMKQAWGDVAEGFTSLGKTLKDRYQADDTEGSASADEAEAALRDVFDRMVTATREFGERTGDVVRDDEVKTQAKQALRSLGDALSATADLIGEQVGGLFKPSRSGRSPATPTSVDDAASGSEPELPQ